MQKNPSFVTMLDGHEALAKDLSPLAFAGFAHFTAMQIRNGKLRGLDLHLKRLRLASLAMFGQAHDDMRVRDILRMAIDAGPSDLSLTATVFSRSGEFSAKGAPDDPAMLVRTFPAAPGPVGPVALDMVVHQRVLAEFKQVGEPMKTYAMRQAARRGYDDALFIDEQGRLAEATIWNLAFWDGESIIWPKADILHGVTMQIVDRQLAKIGIRSRIEEIRLADIDSFSGAALMNSWTPCVPIRKIGAINVAVSEQFHLALRTAYEAEPAVDI
ncbi:MAG: aminotransferase class IV family protein [Paracoccus sp. (in: a-proteobacteria)]|uniref:aminotransferase class IV family protein n=1 Tax=Paracoccus sp. TaxID=267 RepID=UPI0026DF1341|nr:aminotransferase class IV family protein [Paracoccus sp. (in: a-proteobacteria)]MDO5630936.1 aminotransferase class IV family protein [Paracoccus sp. (in: a-proteobacteria)]